MPLIDALRALASQLVLVHHLAFYGPLATALAVEFSDLSQWLIDYARMAVQIFLVVGGFLAARSLAPQGVLLARQPFAL
ncbi:MAG: acyltransferase, partial [Azonexus sp.]|nr:acyltransferase [Azonexus sp.]